MASFDKLTRADMMKYIKDEGLMDEKKKEAPTESEADKKLKAFEKRNKQFEEDKKVMPPRGGRSASKDE